MDRRRWLWQVGPLLVAVAVMATWVYQQYREMGWQRPYSSQELRTLLEQARTFQDNLRAALEPAFQPMVASYVREKYGSSRVSVDIRRVSVRRDGTFPVVAEVAGAVEGLYVQERFLFWWEGERWRMRYVEGDV